MEGLQLSVPHFQAAVRQVLQVQQKRPGIYLGPVHPFTPIVFHEVNIISYSSLSSETWRHIIKVSLSVDHDCNSLQCIHSTSLRTDAAHMGFPWQKCVDANFSFLDVTSVFSDSPYNCHLSRGWGWSGCMQKEFVTEAFTDFRDFNINFM